MKTENTQYEAPVDLLKDKIILITGSSQGIGKAAAICYAKYGATVIVLGRNEKKLAHVYDAIAVLGYPKPAAIQIDLSKIQESDLEGIASTIRGEFGRLDGILHNAHYPCSPSLLVDQKMEKWIDMFRVNTAIPFALTRACLPLLKESADASVILTGEAHAIKPKAYWGAYSISKAGLAHFVTICASEWDRLTNFRINLLIPGPVHSPFRTLTHPGENIAQLPTIDTLMPTYLYWMGKDSRGRSGEIIYG